MLWLGNFGCLLWFGKSAGKFGWHGLAWKNGWMILVWDVILMFGLESGLSGLSGLESGLDGLAWKRLLVGKGNGSFDSFSRSII